MRLPRNILVVALLGGAHSAANATVLQEVHLRWQFKPVGVVDFPGPPPLDNPSFKPPQAVNVHKVDSFPCSLDDAFGEFAAVIDTDGRVASLQSDHEPIAGNPCQRAHLFPVIRNWRFVPARYEGKLVSVYLWIGVEDAAWH